MKNYRVIIIFLLLVQSMSGCKNPQKAFEDVRSENSIESYKEFIKRYSRSDYLDSAKIYLRKAEFEIAVNKKTSDIFESFLQIYPEGEDSRQISEFLVDTKHWDSIKDSNTTKEIKEYLSTFNKGLFTEEAKLLINEIENYSEATDQDIIDAYNNFLKLFPEGRFKLNAQERINELKESHEVYLRVVENESNEELMSFVKRYQNTGYAKLIQNRIEIDIQRDIAKGVLKRSAYDELKVWPKNYDELLVYVEEDPRSSSYPGREAMEQIIAKQIALTDIGYRFHIPDIVVFLPENSQESAEDWKYTISSDNEVYTIKPDYWRDYIPIYISPRVVPSNSWEITAHSLERMYFLDNTIWRIRKELTLSSNYKIIGDYNNPITFILIIDSGLVYMTGYGMVLDPEGTIIFNKERY